MNQPFWRETKLIIKLCIRSIEKAKDDGWIGLLPM